MGLTRSYHMELLATSKSNPCVNKDAIYISAHEERCVIKKLLVGGCAEWARYGFKGHFHDNAVPARTEARRSHETLIQHFK